MNQLNGFLNDSERRKYNTPACAVFVVEERTTFKLLPSAGLNVRVCVCVYFLTRQHGEDGGEGIEFESVDDVAGVEKFQTHEAEADHEQEDVQHLRNHRQPQHTCREPAVTQIYRSHDHEDSFKAEGFSSSIYLYIYYGLKPN